MSNRYVCVFNFMCPVLLCLVSFCHCVYVIVADEDMTVTDCRLSLQKLCIVQIHNSALFVRSRGILGA